MRGVRASPRSSDRGVRACASPRWRAPGRRARAGVCSPAEPPVACAVAESTAQLCNHSIES